jgi:NADH:ubiquinone oxidoreductase subunit 3 (subunit A)
VGRLPIVQQNMNLLLFLVLAVTAGTILLLIAGIIQTYRQKKKPDGQ